MTDSHASHPQVEAQAEPQTPMWLPALGAGLFVAVGLWWAVTPSAPAITADDTAASASASVAAAAPTPPAAPPAAQIAQAINGAVRPSPTAPTPSGIPSGMRHLNPAIEERLKKAHQGMGPPGGPGQHP
ncbi:MAG: hypothetical protein ABSE49_24900 [Polyangiaceae bacterium]|jgi:hypothetical protein